MATFKPTKEQRKAIRNAQEVIQQAFALDSNEAETRKRVERIFEWVLNYDPLKHLSSERAVKGVGESEYVDFAVQPEPGLNVPPKIMVELKSVGTTLSRKHLNQVTSYAVNAGCNWILLTNGRDWQLYHVEFGQPPVVELFDSWNLLEQEVDHLAAKFDLISRKAVMRDALDATWNRVKVLAPNSLLAAILAKDSLKTIRRNLRKNTDILVNDEELLAGISKLLNEAAAVAMTEVKMSRATKRIRKPKPDAAAAPENPVAPGQPEQPAQPTPPPTTT